MEISKTMFKEFSKCRNFFYLNNTHKKVVYSEDKDFETLELLSKMYDAKGDDLITIEDNLLGLMLPYYNKTEELALLSASKYFKKDFIYKGDTRNQKSISRVINDNTFYTYLDGYYEDDDEIIVIEVKATTNNKFMDLGPRINKNKESIFYLDGHLMKIRNDLNDKFTTFLEKLYDPYHEVGQYFYDVAITKFISIDEFRNKNKKVSFYLAILNANYVYDGALVDNQRDYLSNDEPLFTFIECSDILRGYNDIILKHYEAILTNLNNKEINDTYKSYCKECKFDPICYERLHTAYSIRSLIAPKSVDKVSLKEMIDSGLSKLTDIPFESLEKENHIIQRKCVENNTEHIEVEAILEKMNEIKYPIYHLDFESLALPIPRFFGEKPYTQSLFQFSIHVQKEPFVCDPIKDNYYFIPSDFEDRRKELVEEMIRIIDLSKGGTVLVYNEAFEKTRIKELMSVFPQYAKELNNIREHIFDLMHVVKGYKCPRVNYYHPKFEGSFSIKKVLPVFSDLSYKELEVSNGLEAVGAYLRFEHSPKEDVLMYRDHLIKYCGLDTYSMVVILDNLKKRIGRDNYGK